MSPRVHILFFDMNSFFASVAQQEEPALIGRPVGILTAETPGAICIALSVEAKARGLRMGIRQEEARRICPDISFRAARHDTCVDYHHAIRAAVETVLPVEAAHSVDEFSCRLQGPQQELAAALDIARRVQEVILAHIGPAMRSSVGVAPSRLLAKIAAGLRKPCGINWLHPSDLPGKIAHLALRDIPGISRRMEMRLKRAGVCDVAGLYMLAPKEARGLWGNVNGERFLREMHGEEVIWSRRQNQSIGHGQQLTAANRNPEGARLVARRLLVKAGARLRRQNLLAGSLHVEVSCLRHGRSGWSGDIPHTQDSFTLLGIFENCWEHFRIEHPRSVSVMLGRFVSVDQHMGDLFAPRLPGQPSRRERLCAAIDALNQRFGQDTVTFGQLPPHRVRYTGAKIAFQRVPERVEFRE